MTKKYVSIALNSSKEELLYYIANKYISKEEFEEYFAGIHFDDCLSSLYNYTKEGKFTIEEFKYFIGVKIDEPIPFKQSSWIRLKDWKNVPLNFLENFSAVALLLMVIDGNVSIEIFNRRLHFNDLEEIVGTNYVLINYQHVYIVEELIQTMTDDRFFRIEHELGKKFLKIKKELSKDALEKMKRMSYNAKENKAMKRYYSGIFRGR